MFCEGFWKSGGHVEKKIERFAKVFGNVEDMLKKKLNVL